MKYFLIALWGLVIGLQGCSDPGNRYFPLAAGFWWQYNMRTATMDGVREQKMILSNLGDMQRADEVVYRRRSAGGYIFYYKPTADGILRAADIDTGNNPVVETVTNTNPGISRREARSITDAQYVMKQPLSIGTAWQMQSETATLEMSGPPYDTMYQLDTLVTMHYEIVGLDASVSVPAGDFENCMKVEGRGMSKYDAGGHIGSTTITVTTTDWYAPGVGLVKAERREKTTSTILREGTYTLELETYETG